MKRIGTSALILALLSAGCVNPSITRYQDSAVTSRAAREKPSPAPQPPLRKEPVEMYREADSGKRYSLVLKDAELQDVLTLLSRESNLTIVAEKGIDGRVTVNLNNRKLGEVLYAVLKPLGYSASVENGVILIGQPVLVTRSFPINYVKDTRSSTSTTSASVFSGGGNSSNSSSGTTTVVSSGSSGSSGGGGGGSVSITTTGTADFWPALESALEVLIFGNTGEGKRTGSGFIRGDVEKFNVTESESSSGGRKNKSDSNQANDNANARKDGETDSSSSGEKRATSSRSGSADTSSTHTKNDKSAHGRSQENNSSSQANQSISYERKEMKARRQLIVNEMAGMVQVTDYADNIDKVAAFLSDIELAVKRQVLIQAHIIEVTLNDGFSLGLDWQQVFRSAGSTFTIGQALSPVPNSNVFKLGWEGLNSAGNFSVILDAMKDQGQVKMLSSPKISAMNNQKAVIKLTTKQVSWYTKTTTTGTASSVTTTDNVPQIDEVGIFLDVTPQVSREGTVTMQVHPSVSEVKQLSTSPDGKSNKPVIEVREIDTMVDAKSGETVIIAGLIADKLRESKQSVPFLGDIPYAGALFSRSVSERTKTELVIMLTPYFLNEKSIEEIRREHELRMQNMSGDFHLINNLGSMVTEKSSRDAITGNKLQPIRTAPQKEEPPVVAPPPKTSERASPAAAVTVTPEPEAPVRQAPQKTAEQAPKQAVVVSPQPEAVQQLEVQKVEIARLEEEVRATRERLRQEQQENDRLAEERRRADATVRSSSAPTVDAPAVDMSPVNPAGRQPAVTARLQTKSATGDREEALYRSAVTSYKVGDCIASIKAFESFLKLYPQSPFSQDAEYYRKDCADRQNPK